jgi:transposase
VKAGCRWRNLPKEFPEWNAVCHFYARARAKGVWDAALAHLAGKTRQEAGRKPSPTCGELVITMSVAGSAFCHTQTFSQGGTVITIY